MASILYEDWQARRWQLAAATPSARPHVAPQLKVLDYLIHRYRGTDEANRPARFSLRADLVWNSRRIVVHQHLGRGKVAGVKSRAEAEQRVATILHRMASPDREKDDTPTVVGRGEPEVYSARVLATWKAIIWWLKRGYRADNDIQAALVENPVAPRTVMQHLVERMSDISCEDFDALVLFWQCQNADAVNYAAQAWRQRVAGFLPHDLVREELEKYFRHSRRRDVAAERMREELADDNPLVRLAATSLLEEIGELDDIGLLADMLSVAETDEENQHEREALIHAMKSIAERSQS